MWVNVTELVLFQCLDSLDSDASELRYLIVSGTGSPRFTYKEPVKRLLLVRFN